MVREMELAWAEGPRVEPGHGVVTKSRPVPRERWRRRAQRARFMSMQ